MQSKTSDLLFDLPWFGVDSADECACLTGSMSLSPSPNWTLEVGQECQEDRRNYATLPLMEREGMVDHFSVRQSAPRSVQLQCGDELSAQQVRVETPSPLPSLLGICAPLMSEIRCRKAVSPNSPAHAWPGPAQALLTSMGDQ